MQELFETEVVGTGEQRVERRVFKGYGIAQAITIRSTEVAKVEKVSRARSPTSSSKA